MHPKIAIAFFVTAHGFGHAARSCAVMNAIFRKWPFARFEIFTRTPEWFFKTSLAAPYAYHAWETDVGLVQTDPLHFDFEKTLAALDRFLPFADTRLQALADQLSNRNCLLAVSDISPLGIAAAAYAGIPSVLVENFTWDWIYKPYVRRFPRFLPHVQSLEKYYNQANLRIQARPVCTKVNNCRVVPPVARSWITDPATLRQALGISGFRKMVLITMGGIPGNLEFAEGLDADETLCYVVPGAQNVPAGGSCRNNMIFLPQASDFYHPDLVNAADAVVGKLGYSTLAEVYHAGVPYGYVTRPDFRESEGFETFIRDHMSGMEMDAAAFAGPHFPDQVRSLLCLPKKFPDEPNGADAAANYICDFLACEKEILEVVDPAGCVVGAAPRKCVHGNNLLLHRVVHVMVCDSIGRILLQKRSRNKQVAPGRWDTSVGGHVDCGESIEVAMYREMEEELGIRPPSLEFAYQYTHSNDFESELVFTYTCRYNDQILFNPEEIETVRFWDLSEIEETLGKGILSDNFEDEFRRYQKWRKTGDSEGYQHP